MRTRAYRREVRNKHIARKKRIAKRIWGTWYKHDGMYSKGKIHCSCVMCAFRAWDKNTITESDMRKIASMERKLKEYREGV